MLGLRGIRRLHVGHKSETVEAKGILRRSLSTSTVHRSFPTISDEISGGVEVSGLGCVNQKPRSVHPFLRERIRSTL